MNMLIQDLRFSLRQLRRSPGFTATAVLTLALGIGGTTAVLSIANALYFRALPIPEAERVVTVLENRPEGDPAGAFSYPDYLVYQEGAAEAFSELAVIGNSQMGLRTDAGAEPLAGALVSGNYFQMLGVQPALGSFLLPDEDAGGGAAVAVLSHETWRTRFGGDPECSAACHPRQRASAHRGRSGTPGLPRYPDDDVSGGLGTSRVA
jgi:hypothetical protein